jgi:hypothetical protein
MTRGELGTREPRVPEERAFILSAFVSGGLMLPAPAFYYFCNVYFDVFTTSLLSEAFTRHGDFTT